MKYLLLIINILCISNVLSAQEFKGKLLNKQGTPIEYANILLIQQIDSAFVDGTITDENGVFAFSKNLPNNKYLLKMSCIGYDEKYVPLQDSTHFYSIILNEKIAELAEITIKGHKRNIKKNDGGISVNIESGSLVNIGNAHDVLSHLPLLMAKNDGIHVIGKGKPLIYINNRVITDESELQRLSSSNIKKVDIITTPGSEYSSSIHSVVKIHTISPKGTGFEANLQASIIMKERMSEYINSDFRYSHNGLTFYCGGDFWDNQSDYERNTSYITTTNMNSYNGSVKNNRTNTHVTGGFYFDKEKLSMGVKYEYAISPYYKEWKTLEVKDGNTLYNTNDLSNKDSHNHYVNAYCNTQLFNCASELNVDYNNGSYKDLTSIGESNKPLPITYTSEGSYRLFAAKLKMSRELSHKQLEWGAEYSQTSLNSRQNVLESNSEKDLSDMDNQNKQLLGALFTNYRQEWESLFFNAGLRMEYTKFDYYQDSKKIQQQSKKYTAFLPTLSIGYTSDKFEVEVNLKEYINRPSYEELSSATTYTSATTRWHGNPYLESCDTWEISAEALYKDLYFSLGVQSIKNEIFSVNQLSCEDENILIVKPVNLPRYGCYFLDASYSLKSGIWQSIFNTSLQIQNLSYGIPEKKYNQILGEFSIDNSFKFKKNWTLRVSLGYRTKGHYATGYTFGYKNLSLSLFKFLLHKSLQFRLECRDLLNMGREKIKIETNNLSMIDSSIGNTQFIKFSIIYKLDRMLAKYKGRSSLQSERKRLENTIR